MYDEHIYDPDEPTEKAILGVGFEEERLRNNADTNIGLPGLHHL